MSTRLLNEQRDRRKASALKFNSRNEMQDHTTIDCTSKEVEYAPDAGMGYDIDVRIISGKSVVPLTRQTDETGVRERCLNSGHIKQRPSGNHERFRSPRYSAQTPRGRFAFDVRLSSMQASAE